MRKQGWVTEAKSLLVPAISTYSIVYGVTLSGPFLRVYHVVKGTSCRSRRGKSCWLISRQCRGWHALRAEPTLARHPSFSPLQDVIPIAATITFNRIKHTIVVIELIYKLPPRKRTIVSAWRKGGIRGRPSLLKMGSPGNVVPADKRGR